MVTLLATSAPPVGGLASPREGVLLLAATLPKPCGLKGKVFYRRIETGADYDVRVTSSVIKNLIKPNTT